MQGYVHSMNNCESPRVHHRPRYQTVCRQRNKLFLEIENSATKPKNISNSRVVSKNAKHDIESSEEIWQYYCY